MTDESCGACKFFRRFQTMQPMGRCHRNPPVTFPIGQVKNALNQNTTVADSFWPTVPDVDFCGEFKERQNARATAIEHIDMAKLNVEELGGNA